MLVALVGYMGSGKTTIGRAIANRLCVPFIDLDAEIEKQEGKLISEIFRTKGESEFRHIESNVLHSMLTAHSTGIIATGGGTPCFFNQMEELNKHCITIYLECSLETLLHRLANSADERPLLSTLTDREAHFLERVACYAKAQHIVNADDSLTEILNQMEQLILPFTKEIET
jgi:shikimate kinase